MKNKVLNIKLLLAILIILLGFTNPESSTYAQTDSARTKTVRMKDSCSVGNRCGGNCPKMRRDGKGHHGKQMKRNNKGKDTFIDKNGDGINDNRCSGMGLTNCPNAKKIKNIDSTNKEKGKTK